MVQISQENDRIEVQYGTTPKGGELVIVPTNTGLYRVEYRGAGVAPAYFDQLFTSLLLAKRAVDNYRREHAARYAKEELKRRVATGPSIKEQRLAEAAALKNGELEVPDPDEE